MHVSTIAVHDTHPRHPTTTSTGPRPSHPSQIRHALDLILCEGVPLSLRELLCLFAERVRYPVEDAHLLLQCSWTLGYHVKSVTSNGVTRNYWGGGYSQDFLELLAWRLVRD